MWKYMWSWPHILQFSGVFYHNDVPAIVTPWMPAGTVTEYLESHADADRPTLASSSVLPASGVVSPSVLSPCSFWAWSKGSSASTHWT